MFLALDLYKKMKQSSKYLIIAVFFFLTLTFGYLAGQSYAGQNLANRLGGRILLAVEDSGRAWYVDPEDYDRIYLGRPEDAFSLMRDAGIGALDADLAKIVPAELNLAGGNDSDGDGLSDAGEDALGTDRREKDSDRDGHDDLIELQNGYNPRGAGKLVFDSKTVENFSGKILIQVEGRGEAWYVNPTDKKRYFLGKPKDAFNVMRALGLGIKNIDLSMIPLLQKFQESALGDESSSVAQTRTYRAPNGLFSFEYSADWKMEKIEASGRYLYLTDSKKDYFTEGKALVSVIFHEKAGSKLADFVQKLPNVSETNILKFKGYEALEIVYDEKSVDKASLFLSNGKGGVLDFTLISPKGKMASYEKIFNSLAQSASF